jgi:hypothetical protein
LETDDSLLFPTDYRMERVVRVETETVNEAVEEVVDVQQEEQEEEQQQPVKAEKQSRDRRYRKNRRAHRAQEQQVEETEAVSEATPVSESPVKTGLYIGASAADSKNASAEANGEAKYDVTLVAVTVDEAGVITSCIIDSIGASVGFDANGAITSDTAAEVLTKNELGEAYGMKAYAGSAYEWNEQAAAFAQYATGKTAADVAGIAVNEKTAPTDADLASTVTIAIGGFQGLIAKAAQ